MINHYSIAASPSGVKGVCFAKVMNDLRVVLCLDVQLHLFKRDLI